LTQIGVEPRRISAAVLSQNPSTLITRTDIYNERSRARQEHLGDRSPLEALLDELKGDDYWIVKWSEANGRLEILFFASSLQVELMRCFPDILVMDSTYKTNRYRMPLLHFGGTSPMNFLFPAHFAFLLENQKASIPGRLNSSILLSENKIFVCRTSSTVAQ
jgi:hypothetical protein